MVDIPGDPDGRKLHVEYLSVRDSYDLAGKKRKDPDNPKGKRGGLVRREYRLVSRDYGISPSTTAPNYSAKPSPWFIQSHCPLYRAAPSHSSQVDFLEVPHEFDHVDLLN